MKNIADSNLKRFRKLGVTSIIAVYLLIFVGGVVRSTGSGMGCPDWPKCFGQWVPPVSETELNEDYKELYGEKRRQKNEKLANMLSSFGAENTASLIMGDNTMYIEEDFNAVKTWVEYVNRLIGAIIGILLFALFLSALPMFSTTKYLATFSGLIVIVTGIQGWIGSIVVSTKLLPGMITIHMLLALFIISGLIALVVRSYSKFKLDYSNKSLSNLSGLFMAMMLLLIPQIVLGTEVRETVDQLATSNLARNEWIDNMGLTFFIHRSFSWVFLLISVFVMYRIMKQYSKTSLEFKMALVLLAFVGIEMIFGIVMSEFDIPRVVQPFHLVLGTLLFGHALYMYLLSRRVSKSNLS